MICTSDRRSMFPRRYIRKDARSLCLALAFGHMKENAAHKWTGERVLHPLPENAKQQFAAAIERAQWPEDRVKEVTAAFQKRSA